MGSTSLLTESLTFQFPLREDHRENCGPLIDIDVPVFEACDIRKRAKQYKFDLHINLSPKQARRVIFVLALNFFKGINLKFKSHRQITISNRLHSKLRQRQEKVFNLEVEESHFLKSLFSYLHGDMKLN